VVVTVVAERLVVVAVGVLLGRLLPTTLRTRARAKEDADRDDRC
jgi:hypothetical protein